MAKRYRNFKRVSMTPTTARLITEALVDPVLRQHATCHKNIWVAIGEQLCRHEVDMTISVARLIESNMQIGSRRAHLDIPDNPELAMALADGLRRWSWQVGGTSRAFERLANESTAWATRSPLERIAEAGIE